MWNELRRTKKMKNGTQNIILILLIVLICIGVYLIVKVNKNNNLLLTAQQNETTSTSKLNSSTSEAPETPQEEEALCTNTYGPNAYLRDASTGYCGCNIGYTAMYIQGQGEQCVDPSNVLLIPFRN